MRGAALVDGDEPTVLDGELVALTVWVVLRVGRGVSVPDRVPLVVGVTVGVDDGEAAPLGVVDVVAVVVAVALGTEVAALDELVAMSGAVVAVGVLAALPVAVLVTLVVAVLVKLAVVVTVAVGVAVNVAEGVTVGSGVEDGDGKGTVKPDEVVVPPSPTALRALTVNE